ncbi:hypothetical protein HYALB_00000534 [Hymenoscyphus albidus]|uniref:Glycoside hydrolase family 5 domain-containing protein n=1 Tax=Hymenoscyphus albidus TaxID=595503 RepID=A0A9N9M101_9HELO|nr:hypothetical protein HYALB_00000534 [Hymenoscyphus albidus]
MKLSLSLVLGLGGLCLNASVIERRGSTSWAGTNNYYIHGLSAEEQTSYINALKGFETKVIRLWVTGTSDGRAKSSKTFNVPQYETTIGTYVPETLDALDKVLKQLHDADIKAIISPHDANLLPPAGADKGSVTAKGQYDNRLASILNYKSKAFGGKAWKDPSEVILAFDIQNEPMIASKEKLQNNDPDDWICGRAGNMRKVMANSSVKISTGGLGGSEYSGHELNLIDKALNCQAIDLIAIHGYMTQASQWAPYMPELSNKAAQKGKLVFVEEWGVGSDSSYDSVAKQAAVFTDAGVPWMYWQIIPGKSSPANPSMRAAAANAVIAVYPARLMKRLRWVSRVSERISRLSWARRI